MSQGKIESTEILINIIDGKLKTEISSFFINILTEFRSELNLLADSWYNYENGANDLFALIERTYIGILNNAVVRSYPKDSVIQEFSVHFEGKNYGRCDYLVKHFSENAEINFLFEAKQRQFKSINFKNNNAAEFMNRLIDQGTRYFEREAKYYHGSTFIVSCIFEWVREPRDLNSVINEMNCIIPGSNYSVLFRTGNSGLLVYGSLKEVSQYASTLVSPFSISPP